MCINAFLRAFPEKLGARVNIGPHFFIFWKLGSRPSKNPLSIFLSRPHVLIGPKKYGTFFFQLPRYHGLQACAVQGRVHSAPRVGLHCHTYSSVLFTVTAYCTVCLQLGCTQGCDYMKVFFVCYFQRCNNICDTISELYFSFCGCFACQCCVLINF